MLSQPVSVSEMLLSGTLSHQPLDVPACTQGTTVLPIALLMTCSMQALGWRSQTPFRSPGLGVIPTPLSGAVVVLCFCPQETPAAPEVLLGQLSGHRSDFAGATFSFFAGLQGFALRGKS